jgi:hypothetical protein
MPLSNIIKKLEFEIPPQSEPNLRTKEWEFIYFDDVPVLKNTPYRIWMMKDKSEIYIKMRRLPLEGNIDLGFHFEEYREVMFKIDPINNASLRSQYIDMAKGDNRREIYLTPSRILMTKEMRNGGLMERFFARSVLESGKIFEIDEFKYELDTSFYEKVKFLWVLKGKKERVKKANNRFLTEANKIMSGIRDSLDPLEFYKEELTPLEELQKRLGTITSDLTPPPSSLGDILSSPSDDRRFLSLGGRSSPPSSRGGSVY